MFDGGGEALVVISEISEKVVGVGVGGVCGIGGGGDVGDGGGVVVVVVISLLPSSWMMHIAGGEDVYDIPSRIS